MHSTSERPRVLVHRVGLLSLGELRPGVPREGGCVDRVLGKRKMGRMRVMATEQSSRLPPPSVCSLRADLQSRELGAGGGGIPGVRVLRSTARNDLKGQ